MIDYDKLKYVIWCSKYEYNPNTYLTKEVYLNHLSAAKRHHGDCTLEAQSCARCELNEIEILAENTKKYLDDLQSPRND